MAVTNMKAKLAERFVELQEKCYLPPPVHYHMKGDPELSSSVQMEGDEEACPGYNIRQGLEALIELAAEIDFPSYKVASVYRSSIPDKDFSNRLLHALYSWVKDRDKADSKWRGVN